jgi:hypothetical protein
MVVEKISNTGLKEKPTHTDFATQNTGILLCEKQADC